MEDNYYKLIVKKIKIFVGKIDGDDISEIVYLVDDLVDDDITNKYSDLVDDLHSMANAMWCEYGLDYGKTQNWDNTVFNILDFFDGGYVKNNKNLNNLIKIIENGIKIKHG